MPRTPLPIPEGFHNVNSYLVVDGAAEAIDFYSRALGARERYRLPGPGGMIMHAEVQIGDSVVMLADENPEMGFKSPRALGGSPVGLLAYVDDADAVFERAIAAGAKEIKPPEDMFWGDRAATVEDPYGHQWTIATHVEELTPEEIGRRAAAMAG